ncbi:MAG: hypothetical protein U9R37_09070, partial [Campylobacterota bacterium]|nr:hypothetical protein [Campylobacterota bacterium]
MSYLGYKSWHESHANKHKKVVNKLSHLSSDEIINYFYFDNMVKNEPDFCLLYKENKRCHDYKDLNCYLCACPNFRVTKTKSFCDINSKDGSSIKADDGYTHQDCSKCIVPHKKDYVMTHYNRDWNKIFKKTFYKNDLLF